MVVGVIVSEVFCFSWLDIWLVGIVFYFFFCDVIRWEFILFLWREFYFVLYFGLFVVWFVWWYYWWLIYDFRLFVNDMLNVSSVKIVRVFSIWWFCGYSDDVSLVLLLLMWGWWWCIWFCWWCFDCWIYV